jgi:hypothetical protein
VHDLLTALAGGAIGAVLAGIAFTILRLAAVPSDVATHDRRAAALNEDLERWVADDHRKLRQELSGIKNDSAAKGLLYSGQLLVATAEAKTRALQRYRDRETEARRALADLVSAEAWPHAVWRRVAHKPPLALTAPDTVQPVIDDWRAPAAVHPVMNDECPVYDPTAFSTADLLREVREKPLGGPVT